MKNILLLIVVCLFKSTIGSTQVLLPNNFKCIFSEIPGRGYGLTNGTYTFYIDAKSRDLYNQKMEAEFLSKYSKTKDNLYYSTGFKDRVFFYEIVIPESMFVLTLTSDFNNSKFSEFSKQLLISVRKNRNSESRAYFVRKDNKDCIIKVD